MSNAKGSWYFVTPKSMDAPQKVGHNGVIAGLRAFGNLTTDEAVKHMQDHKAGKSPAIGLSNNGFYTYQKDRR